MAYIDLGWTAVDACTIGRHPDETTRLCLMLVRVTAPSYAIINQ